MTTGQLSFDDVLGSYDYSAKSTADKFLKPKISELETYRVEFYDKEEKSRMDWFKVKNESEAKCAAINEWGKNIVITRIAVSDRSLEEILELD